MRCVKILVGPLAAVALLAAGSGVAAAHTFDADSEVTIRHNAEKERFQGRVTSGRPSCVRNRRVVIHRDTPGSRDPAVGEVRSNRNGFWKAQEAVNPRGSFYARVPRRVRTPDGHRHLCRAARSETIQLGD